jgi:hypothetical protein
VRNKNPRLGVAARFFLALARTEAIVFTVKRKAFPLQNSFVDIATGETLDTFARSCVCDGDPLKSPFSCGECGRSLNPNKDGSPRLHFWRTKPRLPLSHPRGVCENCVTITEVNHV